MPTRSLLVENQQLNHAVQLIKLGARMAVLESETDLSYERLLRLYKEIHKKSPPKGMLPFSTDWFVTWQPNIHSSIFINVYQHLVRHAQVTGIDPFKIGQMAGRRATQRRPPRSLDQVVPGEHQHRRPHDQRASPQGPPRHQGQRGGIPPMGPGQPRRDAGLETLVPAGVSRLLDVARDVGDTECRGAACATPAPARTPAAGDSRPDRRARS